MKWTDERRQAFREKITGHTVSAETRQKISANHKAAGVRPSREAIEKSNRDRPRGAASPNWKGGTCVVNGYRCIRLPDHHRAFPNGYVYEHIVVAEQVIGRMVLPGEVVHHIDGDKRNNAPENLAVLPSQAEHIRLHRRRGDID